MADVQYPFKVDGGEILGPNTRPGDECMIKLYDFKRPDKFSKEQIRTYSIIHETIGRSIGPALSSVLGENTSVEVSLVDQLTFHEILEEADEFAAYAILQMRPLRGPALLQLDPNMVNALVHRSCGGQGSPDSGLHTLTEIESLIILDMMESLMPAFDDGWEKIAEIDCHVTSIESHQRHAIIVPPTEMIILAELKIVTEEANWYLKVIVPYIAIESVISRLSAQWWYRSVRRPRANPPLGSQIANIPVGAEIAVDLGKMMLKDLPAFAAGDPLLIPDESPLILSVGGVDVAEMELPSSYAELPEELRIIDFVPSDFSTELPDRDPGAPADQLQKIVASAISELKGDIRNVRDAVNELVDNRLPVESDHPELDAGFQASQIKDVAVALLQEAPQTMAFVLGPLEPSVSAGVLAAFPDELRTKVVSCLAQSGPASKLLHRRITSLIARNASLALRRTVSGGYETTVQILNQVPQSVERQVMGQLQIDDPSLFEELASRMFVFEDFVLVDAKAIQKLALRVAAEEFAMALKRTIEPVRNHIMDSLQPEYAAEVEAATSELGRVRLIDVEAAQKDIVEELRQLDQAGEVIVARPSDMVD